jgi:hypothetical protein
MSSAVFDKAIEYAFLEDLRRSIFRSHPAFNFSEITTEESGQSGWVQAPYPKGSFDSVAACVIPEDAWYVIPEREIRGLKSISLCTMRGEAKYEVYRQAWGLLRKASDIGDPESGAEQPPTAQSHATQLTGGLQRMAAAANYFKRSPERGSVVPKKAEESEARFGISPSGSSHPDVCHTAELDVATGARSSRGISL